MGKISTKTAPTGGNNGGTFVNKSLQPGNVKCKINSIQMQKNQYSKDREEWNILLNMEGEPLPAPFTGFPVDFKNPSGEKYKGQQATVKALQYNTYDGKSPNGYDQSIEASVMGFLNDFAIEAGFMDYWLSIDLKFNTVQEIVADLDRAKPFENIWLTYCLGARSYINGKGYTAYDLFIARADKGTKSFCADPAQVCKFVAEKHVIKNKPKDPKPAETKSETPHTDAINEDFKAQKVAMGNPFPEEKQVAQSDVIHTNDNSDDLPFSID